MDEMMTKLSKEVSNTFTWEKELLKIKRIINN